MDDSSIPIVIDIEASGFGQGSYPIEIGIVMPNGTAFCYLIQPYDDWIHWEQEAEQLHGLSRKTAERFGMNGEYVARQLNKHLEGQTVYSDAVSHDTSWLAALFEQSGVPQGFQLADLASITSDEQKMIWDQTREQVLNESGLKRHRASADARVIQTTWLKTCSNKRASSM